MALLRRQIGLLVLILLCVASADMEAAVFYPATLRDMAQRSAAEFPWAAEIRTRTIANAKPWLEMSDEDLWSMMFGSTITRSWMVWSDGYCPACRKPVPMYNWRMEPLKRPWKVACPHCSEIFPKNDFAAFYRSGLGTDGVFDPKKADRSLLINPEHPDPADPLHTYGVDDGEGYAADGHRWRFIGAYLVYGQWKQQVLGGVMNLAGAYIMTGDPAYAHRAAILLDRVADLYPTFDYATQGLTYEIHNGDGYVSVWHDACEETRQLALAYDAIGDGLTGDEQVIRFLSGKAKQCGLANGKTSIQDIRRNIEQGILRDALAHVPKITSNYPRTDSATATIHTILDPVGSRQKVREILDDIIRRSTAVDGTTGEKGLTAYSALGVQALAQILALFDRMEPGFLEDALRRFPALRQTYRLHIDTWFQQMYYPNCGDSGAFASRVEGYAGIRLSPPGVYANGDCWNTPLQPSMHSFLWRLYQVTGDVDYLKILYLGNGKSFENLPCDPLLANPAGIRETIQQVIARDGTRMTAPSVNKQQWHLAMLRAGDGTDARAAWLDYDIGGRHSHADGMNLGLYAKGLDLMPDFGYPPVNFGGWGSPRARWYTMAAAHNTVVVDGKDFAPIVREQIIGGRTTLWADGRSLRAIRVSCPEMIAGKQFERTVAAVDLSGSDSYILDLFRVIGGTDHARFMHSSFGQLNTTGLTLEPANEYGHDTQMRAFRRDSNPRSGWSADWKVEDHYRYLKAGADVHLRYTDLTPGAQAMTCEGWVLAGSGSYASSEEVWIPRLLVRRQGTEAPLASTFVGVIEPYEGKSNISGIRRLDLHAPAGQLFNDANVAVEVSLADGRKDLLISSDVENPLQKHPSLADGHSLMQKDWNVQFDGDMCAIRRGMNGAIEYIALCNARSLSVGGLRIRLDENASFVEIRIANGKATMVTGRPQDVRDVSLEGSNILVSKPSQEQK